MRYQIVGNQDGRVGYLVVANEEETPSHKQCDRKPRSGVTLADLERSIIADKKKSTADQRHRDALQELNRHNREFYERGER